MIVWCKIFISFSLQSREVQLAKTLVITLAVFAICWLPSVILFITDIVITEENEKLKKCE